ncbi:MAG TPA: hypothetical protein VF516_15260 [Kofleriaceae bacterium]
MTLLVGIRCSDGVVVAADRAVTLGSMEQPTISHPACKISVLDGSVIVAGSGYTGTLQRFCDVVEDTLLNCADCAGYQQKRPIEIGRILCTAGRKDFQSTMMKDGIFGALVAFPSVMGRGPQLCEFHEKDFQPDLKDAGTWFVSMGYGRPIADSYLAFMRDTFWRGGMPTLAHGIFSAAWVMQQSIRVSPGFIDEPIDIAVLQGEKARMLEPRELTYHMGAVDRAMKHFGTFDPTASAPGIEQTAAVPLAPSPEPPPK